jgi:hypothetical protein
MRKLLIFLLAFYDFNESGEMLGLNTLAFIFVPVICALFGVSNIGTLCWIECGVFVLWLLNLALFIWTRCPIKKPQDS